MKYLFTCWLLLFLFSCTKKEKDKPVVMKILPDYPSASAVEYLDGKLYVMGDDATKLLVLDTNFNAIDSILLFNYPNKRIPKDIKHDIESMMMLSNDSNKLLLFGSGSLTPYRDSVVIVDFATRKKESKAITDFYNLVKSKGIQELNIEGAAHTDLGFVLANRGHLGWPKNNLIFAMWLRPEPASMDVIQVKGISDSSSFQGISGLAYSMRNDALIMTASTEQTASSLADGAIGKSYIWIIKKLSYAIGKAELSPDIVIDFEEIDPVFKGQKIESVTILNETKESLRLVLVADNDNGSSTIFKLSIKIN
jgi:hypothetical protein